MVERFGAIVRWNPAPEYFPPEDFRSHISATGSSPGLTWLCNLKNIEAGHMIVVLGPKGTPHSGIVAIGEALGPRKMGKGLTGGKEAWRIPVSLRSVSLDLSVLREDVENLVQGPIYLNREEYDGLLSAIVSNTFRSDIEAEDTEKTLNMFIYDDDGRFVDSSFFAVRQENHIAIHILSSSSTTGYNLEMKNGKRIMLERIRNNGYSISGILTGSTARNRTTGRAYSPAERIVREGGPIQFPEGNLQEYVDELWDEARSIASASEGLAGNPHRSLRIYLDTSESPKAVLHKLVTDEKHLKPITRADPEKIAEVNNSRPRAPVSADVLRRGFVYLLQNPSWPGWIKVGKTSNLEGRRSSFNTSAPHVDALFEYIDWFESDIALDIEQSVHAYLRSNYTRNRDVPMRHGEWYFMEQEVVVEIIQLCWRD